MSLKKTVINLLIYMWFVLASELIFITSVEAVTQDFQWTGLKGYSVKGTYSYDKATVKGIISEQGAGSTNQLESMKVTFYDPDGKAIYQNFNVVDSESQGNYFEFNLDMTTKQLTGNIDVGGEQSGELFLKGNVNHQLYLIEIESSGHEHILDSN